MSDSRDTAENEAHSFVDCLWCGGVHGYRYACDGRIEALQRAEKEVLVTKGTLRSWQALLEPIRDWNTSQVCRDIADFLYGPDAGSNRGQS